MLAYDAERFHEYGMSWGAEDGTEIGFQFHYAKGRTLSAIDRAALITGFTRMLSRIDEPRLTTISRPDEE